MKTKRAIFGIGKRLTLWGAGITTLLCVALSCTLYAGMFYSLRSQIDSFLEGEIREALLTVNEHPDDNTGLEQALRRELGVRSHNDLGFRMLDDEGHVIVSSFAHDPLGDLWVRPDDWKLSPSHVECEDVHPTTQQFAYRVCSMRITTAGQAYTAQSSFLLDRMAESLATFRRIGIIAMFVSLLVALGVGGFLSHRSLQPVRAIMQAARTMSARDLHSRLALSGTGDELDQLTVTLNSMLDRIEHQVREIQRFTADASHELRTPLAALQGMAEVALSRMRSADELRQVIEESLSHYARLQRIAEDLLLLARLDAGEPILRSEPVALDQAVSDVVDLYTPTAEEKGLTLSFKQPEALLVKGDGGRLRQVIGNLVDNALKFTPPTGEINVSVSRVNGNGRVEVSDNGIGIPADELPNVFERFYRTDRARSGVSGKGAGLGLSICRSIVNAHGGTIRILSQPDRGTTAIVELPIATSE